MRNITSNLMTMDHENSPSNSHLSRLPLCTSPTTHPLNYSALPTSPMSPNDCSLSLIPECSLYIPETIIPKREEEERPFECGGTNSSQTGDIVSHRLSVS